MKLYRGLSNFCLIGFFFLILTGCENIPGDLSEVADIKKDEFKKSDEKSAAIFEPKSLEAFNNGFIVFGGLIGDGGFVKAYDKDLNELWYQSFEGTINALKVNRNGKVLVAGDKVNSKPWYAMLDADGTVLWSRDLTGICSIKKGSINHIIELKGAYFLAGWKTRDHSAIYTQPLLMKLTENGQFDSASIDCWELNELKSAKGYDEITGMLSVNGPDGQKAILVSGTSSRVITGESTWIALLDMNGSEIFSKSFTNTGSSCALKDLAELEDGFIGTGSWGTDALWIIKLSRNGNVLFDKKYKSNLGFIAQGNDVEPTPDGGYIICGFDVGNVPTGWLLKGKDNELEWVNYIGPVQKMFEIKGIKNHSQGFVVTGAIINSAQNKKLKTIHLDHQGKHDGVFE